VERVTGGSPRWWNNNKKIGNHKTCVDVTDEAKDKMVLNKLVRSLLKSAQKNHLIEPVLVLKVNHPANVLPIMECHSNALQRAIQFVERQLNPGLNLPVEPQEELDAAGADPEPALEVPQVPMVDPALNLAVEPQEELDAAGADPELALEVGTEDSKMPAKRSAAQPLEGLDIAGSGSELPDESGFGGADMDQPGDDLETGVEDSKMAAKPSACFTGYLPDFNQIPDKVCKFVESLASWRESQQQVDDAVAQELMKKQGHPLLVQSPDLSHEDTEQVLEIFKDINRIFDCSRLKKVGAEFGAEHKEAKKLSVINEGRMSFDLDADGFFGCCLNHCRETIPKQCPRIYSLDSPQRVVELILNCIQHHATLNGLGTCTVKTPAFIITFVSVNGQWVHVDMKCPLCNGGVAMSDNIPPTTVCCPTSTDQVLSASACVDHLVMHKNVQRSDLKEFLDILSLEKKVDEAGKEAVKQCLETIALHGQCIVDTTDLPPPDCLSANDGLVAAGTVWNFMGHLLHRGPAWGSTMLKRLFRKRSGLKDQRVMLFCSLQPFNVKDGCHCDTQLAKVLLHLSLLGSMFDLLPVHERRALLTVALEDVPDETPEHLNGELQHFIQEWVTLKHLGEQARRPKVPKRVKKSAETCDEQLKEFETNFCNGKLGHSGSTDTHAGGATTRDLVISGHGLDVNTPKFHLPT